MTSLIIVQRVTGGRAWTGKIVDCVLLQQDAKQEAGKEDVSTIGFNPNPQLSYATQEDFESGDTRFDKTCRSDQEHQHDVTVELRAVEDKT